VRPDDNWRIIPEAARRVLVQESLAEARGAPLK